MRNFCRVTLLSSICLTAATEVSAQSFPYFDSAEFDNGDYGPYPNRTYISEPGLTSPRLNILKLDERCDSESYVMTSLRGDKVDISGQSPMIHDNDGHLIWMNATYGETFGLSVQKYKGQDYLTFWQGDDAVGGHGEGVYYMLDSSYREAYRITAGNGLPGDLHEFKITNDDTALVTIYPMIELPDSRNRKLYVWDSVMQEINIETSEVLFEWRASDHYSLRDSYYPPGANGRNSAQNAYDFFHVNSIDKDAAGNYLISSRYMQSLTYIDGATGAVLWVLGGKKNGFEDLSDGAATAFSWQHDARWTADHSGITLFDNGARYGLKPRAHASRAVHIALDLVAMTASLTAAYVNPRNILSASQGSVQVLANGNVLVGYGYNAAYTEFAATGEPLCDVHIGAEKFFGHGAVQTYKVHKHPWIGKPATQPQLRVLAGAAAVSWNGATEVRQWMWSVSRSSNPATAPFHLHEMVLKEGFETSWDARGSEACYVRASALDKDGVVIGTSAAVSTGECDFDSENAEEDFDNSFQISTRIFALLAFIGAAAGMFEVWRSGLLRRIWGVVGVAGMLGVAGRTVDGWRYRRVGEVGDDDYKDYL